MLWGLISVAYGDVSNGTYLGPLPTSFISTGGHIVITHEGSTLTQRGDPQSYIGYEVM